jgi:DNA-binding transcriptional LysR family regulator
MDRLQAMTVFVKVVEQGSFARAAERLDLSTSAVSRHVADLEAHLVARLLNRTTRRLSLTESGQSYYERCVQLLADLEETETLVSAATVNPAGTIKLTCSITFGVRHMAPAIGAFQAQFPAVRFDCSLSDRFVDLVEEGLDLAIRIGNLGDTNLIARKIGETRMIACASPAYLKRRGTPKRPQDLGAHNCFTYEYVAVKNHWRFREKAGAHAGAAISVPISGSMHANNGEMLAAIAAEGVGIVIEPDFIVGPLIESGKLVPILKGFEPPHSGIYAVYPSRRHLSAKVRAFVDFLAARFADQKAFG